MDKFSWANQTELHPFGLAALVVLGLMAFVLPRRYTPIPILIMACMIPSRQRIVIFELDWTFLRLLVVAGWLRVLARGEARRLKWVSLDSCVVALSIVTILASTANFLSMDVFIRNLGVAVDSVGTYLLFRVFIRGWNDLILALRVLVLLGVPVAAAMMYEEQSGHNMFHVFGGVPEFTQVRQDRIRAQGAFSHPILAGCFWASLLPLFAGLAAEKRANLPWAIVGITASSICIYCSASSTPVMGAFAAVLGAALYVVRRRMRLIRWSLLGVLVSLHMVMKAPVWHLIARIDAVGGSTGWHRYMLIDRAIRNFGDWCLIGSSGAGSWEVRDITNQYLVHGFHGGFVALCLFIAIISLGYQAVGRSWRANRRNRGRSVLAWMLGVSLFTHTLMFIAVSYFGQIQVLWWLLVAVLGSLAAAHPRRPRKRVAAKATERAPDERGPKPVATGDPPAQPSLAGDRIGPSRTLARSTRPAGGDSTS